MPLIFFFFFFAFRDNIPIHSTPITPFSLSFASASYAITPLLPRRRFSPFDFCRLILLSFHAFAAFSPLIAAMLIFFTAITFNIVFFVTLMILIRSTLCHHACYCHYFVFFFFFAIIAFMPLFAFWLIHCCRRLMAKFLSLFLQLFRMSRRWCWCWHMPGYCHNIAAIFIADASLSLFIAAMLFAMSYVLLLPLFMLPCLSDDWFCRRFRRHFLFADAIAFRHYATLSSLSSLLDMLMPLLPRHIFAYAADCYYWLRHAARCCWRCRHVCWLFFILFLFRRHADIDFHAVISLPLFLSPYWFLFIRCHFRYAYFLFIDVRFLSLFFQLLSLFFAFAAFRHFSAACHALRCCWYWCCYCLLRCYYFDFVFRHYAFDFRDCCCIRRYAYTLIYTYALLTLFDFRFHADYFDIFRAAFSCYALFRRRLRLHHTPCHIMTLALLFALRWCFFFRLLFSLSPLLLSLVVSAMMSRLAAISSSLMPLRLDWLFLAFWCHGAAMLIADTFFFLHCHNAYMSCCCRYCYDAMLIRHVIFDIMSCFALFHFSLFQLFFFSILHIAFARHAALPCFSLWFSLYFRADFFRFSRHAAFIACLLLSITPAIDLADYFHMAAFSFRFSLCCRWLLFARCHATSPFAAIDIDATPPSYVTVTRQFRLPCWYFAIVDCFGAWYFRCFFAIITLSMFQAGRHDAASLLMSCWCWAPWYIWCCWCWCLRHSFSFIHYAMPLMLAVCHADTLSIRHYFRFSLFHFDVYFDFAAMRDIIFLRFLRFSFFWLRFIFAVFTPLFVAIPTCFSLFFFITPLIFAAHYFHFHSCLFRRWCHFAASMPDIALSLLYAFNDLYAMPSPLFADAYWYWFSIIFRHVSCVTFASIPSSSPHRLLRFLRFSISFIVIFFASATIAFHCFLRLFFIDFFHADFFRLRHCCHFAFDYFHYAAIIDYAFFATLLLAVIDTFTATLHFRDWLRLRFISLFRHCFLFAFRHIAITPLMPRCRHADAASRCRHYAAAMMFRRFWHFAFFRWCRRFLRLMMLRYCFSICTAYVVTFRTLYFTLIPLTLIIAFSLPHAAIFAFRFDFATTAAADDTPILPLHSFRFRHALISFVLPFRCF